ncbi:hypothetical protein KUTeg_003303 [Tegillarca granosa]|uniref:SAM domain-containing protein n=1 Tax=Tegillarca granosa TaxID=220873 RepID=A0ABQ9FNK8_TEGGR|nr:hypothetical protein KUTeg_003303 [Tegillarca granosa]
MAFLLLLFIIYSVNGNGKYMVNHAGGEHGGDWSYVPYSVASDMRATSPSKGSPTNSNRNSVASSDSGRGTGHLEPRAVHSYVNVQINNQHRLSNQSYESGVSSRQSYHSTSSSSVGSLDRLEETGHSSQINVAELFQAGMPDHEVMRAWLRDLRYEEYHNNFMQAGYDMPTVSRMTPEDLTAIGITKPGHRKRLKAEIARLNIHDGIPEHVPNDVLEWLRYLHLEHYYSILSKQGYNDIESLTDITWEDLEEIGIQKLGHQKKIMLAIERIKRIISGTKRISTVDGSTHRSSAEILESLENNNSRWSGEVMSMSYNQEACNVPVIARKSSSGDSLNTNSSGEYRSFRHHSASSLDSTSNLQHSPSSSKPDVVAIQVKRQSSHSGSGTVYAEAKDMGGMPITYQSFQGPGGRKTPDELDREATPTGDDFNQVMSSSPCHKAPVAPKAIIKPKPVAKIIAKSKRTSRENSPDIIDNEMEKNNDLCKSPAHANNVFFPSGKGSDALRKQNSEHIYAQPNIHSPKLTDHLILPTKLSMSQSVPTGSVTPISVSTQESLHQSVPSPSFKTKKVAPPPPPKRTNSISHKSDLNLKEDMSHFAGSMPKSALQNAQQPKSNDQCLPQNAFATCVQSLSQKFGRKRVESEESPGSDGEEFPPPPPPMAMDIITPKIHNYGIPSKSEKNSMGSEYRLPVKQKSDTNTVNSPVHSVEDTFGVKLRSSQMTTQTTTTATSVSSTSVSQPPPQPQPPHVLSVTQNHQHQSVSVPNSKSVPEHHECVVHAQQKVKSDTSKTNDMLHLEHSAKKAEVKRNDSLSSIDSNTLPFANENVGTIKQRTPTTKPSVVDVMEDPHRQHNLNSSVSHIHENGSPVIMRQRPEVKAKPMVPQKPSVTVDAKDNLRKGKSEDVLNDIDNMLQGLTDELDAMLEEELQIQE